MEKLAFVIPSFSIGGAQWNMIRCINGLVSMGYPVSVIVVDSDLEMAPELSPGVELHVLGGSSSSPITWAKFIRTLHKLDADVVIGRSIQANLMVGIANLMGFTRKAVVIEANYPPIQLRQMAPARAFIVRRLTPFVYRRADIVSANSDQSLRFLRSWVGPGPRYERTFNPVSFTHLHHMSMQAVPLPEISPHELVLLVAGRMWAYQKGLDVILRACARLKDHPVSWKLWMVGDGGDLGMLKQQAIRLGLEKRIVWTGMQSNPFPFIREADIVVLPSRFEGFPNVLLEAMALGKATVASDCKTGPREMTVGGQFGDLFPVDDDEGLAKALSALMNDPARRAKLGEAAARHIATTYSDEKVFSQLVRVIEAQPPGKTRPRELEMPAGIRSPRQSTRKI